jgi:hypothetical protein
MGIGYWAFEQACVSASFIPIGFVRIGKALGSSEGGPVCDFLSFVVTGGTLCNFIGEKIAVSLS